MQELERYANQFKCFGRHTNDYQSMIDNQVDLTASNLDLELANLLANHEEAQALEPGSEERLAAHRAAADALGKPKSHQDRIAFEREQQAAIERNGDSGRFQR